MTEDNKERISQLNDMFDELFSDAKEFAQDFSLALNLIPYSSFFFFIFGVTYFWLTLDFFSNNIAIQILGLFVGVFFTAFGILIFRRYMKMKKKYKLFIELTKKEK